MTSEEARDALVEKVAGELSGYLFSPNAGTPVASGVLAAILASPDLLMAAMGLEDMPTMPGMFILRGETT